MAEQQQLVHDFRIVCMGLGSRLNPKLILLRSGPVHALLPQYMKIKHVNYHKKAMVARCTQIISPNTEDAKYVINFCYPGKYAVALGDTVSPTDIEEGMRVG